MKKFCDQCGTALMPTAKFCVNCGNKIPNIQKATDLINKTGSTLEVEQIHKTTQSKNTELPIKKVQKKYESNDEINKLIKRIDNAGTSAIAFGWLLLVISPIFIYLASSSGSIDKTISAVFWVLAVLIALEFIYSGKQIKAIKGRSVGIALLFNGFLSIILARGIIPLILSYQSFSGYFALKKLKKIEHPPYIQSKKSRLNVTEKIILVALIVLGSASIAAFSNTGSSTSTYNSDQSSKKTIYENLTKQYEECSSSLESRIKNLDKTSQTEVDNYNTDLAICEAIRQKQNSATEEYNNSIGL